MTLSQNLSGLAVSVNEERKKLGGYGGTECELRYVNFLRQTNKLYGSTFFPCVEQVSRERKEEVLLAVAETGISFLQPLTRQPTKKSFRLEELVEVDFKDQGFFSTLSFSVGQFLQKKTYTFETKQGRQIKDLINNYLEGDD